MHIASPEKSWLIIRECTTINVYYMCVADVAIAMQNTSGEYDLRNTPN